MPGGFLSLFAMLLVLGIVAGAAAVFLMVIALLRPPRMTDGRAAWVLRRLSPSDLGLAYETSPFTIRDYSRPRERITLTGWWIPASKPTDRCVALLHDYGDAKVGVIAWAPLWHSLGFHVLAMDLRAHGDSGGRYSTGGYWERHDLAQAINDLRAERRDQTRRLVLFGVGLGAAVAAATAAMRDDIAAVVLDSPFADFVHFAEFYMDRMGFPGRGFQRLSIGLAAKIAQADFRGVRPLDWILKIRCPLMIISPVNDPANSPGDTEAIEASVASRSRGQDDVFWRILSAGHGLGMVAEPVEYADRIRKFVGHALSQSPEKA